MFFKHVYNKYMYLVFYQHTSCVIDGVCYRAMEMNPDNDEEICDPAKSEYDWSILSDVTTDMSTKQITSGMYAGGQEKYLNLRCTLWHAHLSTFKANLQHMPLFHQRIKPRSCRRPLIMDTREKKTKMGGKTGSVSKSGIKYRSSLGSPRTPQAAPDSP